MKIAYVTTYNAGERYYWSGLGQAIMECLRKQSMEVVPFGPLRTRHRWLGRIREYSIVVFFIALMILSVKRYRHMGTQARWREAKSQ